MSIYFNFTEFFVILSWAKNFTKVQTHNEICKIEFLVWTFAKKILACSNFTKFFPLFFGKGQCFNFSEFFYAVFSISRIFFFETSLTS